MSTISPPAVTTGTEGGKGKQAKVKKESTEEEGEKDKPYQCERCVKRYSRRDYLERHLLNRMSPVTNDMLSMHLLSLGDTSSVSREGSVWSGGERRGADG